MYPQAMRRCLGTLLLGLGLLIGLTSHVSAQSFPARVGVGAAPNENYIDLYYPYEESITPITFPEATGGTGTLTYDLDGGYESLGLTFDADTRVLSGSPNLAGAGPPSGNYWGFPGTYSVEDQSGGFASVTVYLTICEGAGIAAGTTACSAPAFVEFHIPPPPPQIYVVDQPITSITLLEASGGTGTNPLRFYRLTGLPAGLTFDAISRVLSGTPTAIGTSDVTYRVHEAATLGELFESITGTIQIVDSVTNTNNAPTITGSPATTVAQGGDYSFTPVGADVDAGTTLTYTITNTPTWAAFSTTTGALTGTPDNDDIGVTNGIVITVSDGTLEAGLASFNLTVTNVNDAPTITGSPATTVAQGGDYSFTPGGGDVDADTLVYSIANQPTWAAFSTTTGALTGTPDNDDVGVTNGIVITVSDGTLSASLPAFNLTVTNVNDAPTITGTPATTVAEDVAYSFTPVGADVDAGTTLTYSITNRPNWAAFSATTGALTGTPDNGDVGVTNDIVITVSDGTLTASLPRFNLTVSNVNDAPTITGSPATTVAEDSAYSFTPVGGDVDAGTTLTYTITNTPTWADFSSTTGALTGTPDNDNIGVTRRIVITVSDGTLEADLAAFNLTVTNTNDAPVGVPTITGTVTQGETLTADTTDISDVDGLGDFSYQWKADDVDILGATSETFILTEDEVGKTITVTVSYTDDGGFSESVTSEVTDVVADDEPPTVVTEENAEGFGMKPSATDSTGMMITLQISEAVDISKAKGNDFTVTSTLGGVATIHEVIDIREGSIILFLETAIPQGAEIEVAYTPDEDITDMDGNVLRPFVLQIVNKTTEAVKDPNTGFAELNKVILPEIARAMADQTVSAITQRMDQARSGEGSRSVTIAGQSTLTGVASAHGQALADGSLSVKDVLGNSDFVLPLADDGAGNGMLSSLTLWGGGSYRNLEASGEAGSGEKVNFDGDLFSAHLGLDVRPRADLLTGLAVSWGQSDLDYDSEDLNLKGDYKLDLTSVQPYASWEMLAGQLDLWATAGYGWGDLEITDEGQDDPASSDVNSWNVAMGGNIELLQQGPARFRLKSSALLTEMEVEGSDDIEALKVESTLLRMALEGTYKHALADGAYVEPSLEAGVRYDGGDGETGFGAELGAGFRYTDPVVGLTLEGKARTLVGRDNYEEWGISGLILLEQDRNGRGLSFSLSPGYGDTGSGTQKVWQEGLRDETSRDYGARLDARMGYGMAAPV